MLVIRCSHLLCAFVMFCIIFVLVIFQDKAVTESDVSHTNSKKLRTVKSAENLFPSNAESSQQLVTYAFSPLGKFLTTLNVMLLIS